jgi:hypothetical protein
VGLTLASAKANAPELRKAAEEVKSAIIETIGVSDASPVPRRYTGGFGPGTARVRSADVTTKAPPPSVTRQHSSKCMG